jgi:hypothetical protein
LTARIVSTPMLFDSPSGTVGSTVRSSVMVAALRAPARATDSSAPF